MDGALTFVVETQTASQVGCDRWTQKASGGLATCQETPQTETSTYYRRKVHPYFNHICATPIFPNRLYARRNALVSLGMITDPQAVGEFANQL